jgi:hypothetical protein
MTNSADRVRGNEVVMYDRRTDGTLVLRGYFYAGGVGSGPAPTSTILGFPFPATIDGLGSQHSLVVSSNRRWLFVVNAGSNTVSSFRISLGEGLHLVSTVASGGMFPVSLAADDSRLYVLNSGGQGSIQGFTVEGDGELTPLSGSHLDLGAAVTTPSPTEVLTSPAQIGFTPEGDKLVVTVKGIPPSAGRIIVYSVDHRGRPYRKVETTVTPSSGLGPFSFEFHRRGHLIVTNGFTGDITSYDISDDNRLVQLGAPISTGTFAPCWIAQSGRFSYVGNIGAPYPGGGGIISGFSIDRRGRLTSLGVAATLPTLTPDNHAIDLTVVDGTGSGPFLYFLQSRVGMIGMERIESDGRLIDLGSVGGLDPGPDPNPATNPGILAFSTRCFLQGPSRSPECAKGSAQGIVGF